MFRQCFGRIFSYYYEKTRLYGSVYDSSVDFDTIGDDILDIHRCLMRQHDFEKSLMNY